MDESKDTTEFVDDRRLNVNQSGRFTSTVNEEHRKRTTEHWLKEAGGFGRMQLMIFIINKILHLYRNYKMKKNCVDKLLYFDTNWKYISSYCP